MERLKLSRPGEKREKNLPSWHFFPSYIWTIVAFCIKPLSFPSPSIPFPPLGWLANLWEEREGKKRFGAMAPPPPRYIALDHCETCPLLLPLSSGQQPEEHFPPFLPLRTRKRRRRDRREEQSRNPRHILCEALPPSSRFLLQYFLPSHTQQTWPSEQDGLGIWEEEGSWLEGRKEVGWTI